MTKAFVSGCAGPTLSGEEIAFFKDEEPWGLILFARNIDTPDQVAALTAAFRTCVGRPDAPVLVDQEGGRVQRLKAPHWPAYPAPRRYGDLHDLDREAGLRAAWLGGYLIASDLRALGITIDCLPCLDVRFPETADAIGDRALSGDPETVAALGHAMAGGARAGGVLPVIKHMPGHGRATVDSHLELPRVSAARTDLEAVDFHPFRVLNDTALGMTAHLLYETLDPAAPGTQSTIVINDIIRKEIGFDGCLMTDDISMEALGGGVGERAGRAIAAGCDLVLHCNGKMAEMRAVAGAVPVLTGRPLERCQSALAGLGAPGPAGELTAARDEFRSLMDRAGS